MTRYSLVVIIGAILGVAGQRGVKRMSTSTPSHESSQIVAMQTQDGNLSLLQISDPVIEVEQTGPTSFFVKITFMNQAGQPLDRRTYVHFWLSDSAVGRHTETPADLLDVTYGVRVGEDIAGVQISAISTAYGYLEVQINQGNAPQTYYPWISVGSNVYRGPEIVFPAAESSGGE